jgi:hypothetical protein
VRTLARWSRVRTPSPPPRPDRASRITAVWMPECRQTPEPTRLPALPLAPPPTHRQRSPASGLALDVGVPPSDLTTPLV